MAKGIQEVPLNVRIKNTKRKIEETSQAMQALGPEGDIRSFGKLYQRKEALLKTLSGLESQLEGQPYRAFGESSAQAARGPESDRFRK